MIWWTAGEEEVRVCGREQLHWFKWLQSLRCYTGRLSDCGHLSVLVENWQAHKLAQKLNLWKMKIFSRFHYVWYLVSDSDKEFNYMCTIASVHLTMWQCPKLLVCFWFFSLSFFLYDFLKILWCYDGFADFSVRKCKFLFCVLFFCYVWHFRRWQSLTFYQTAANFVPGGRPPYVVNASIFIWLLCCNPVSASVFHHLTSTC